MFLYNYYAYKNILAWSTNSFYVQELPVRGSSLVFLLFFQDSFDHNP